MSYTRRQILSGALQGIALVGAARLGLRQRLAHAGEEHLLTRVSRPQDLETPVEFLDGDTTPNEVFFVRSHFGPAIVDERRFRLIVDGLVTKRLSLSLAELKRFPEVTVPAMLQCSGNGRGLFTPRVPGAQWMRGAVGQAAWTGVRLLDVLEHAGVRPGARYLRLLGADHPPMSTVPPFARSLPLDKAVDPSTIIAYGMNGAPLPLLHGAPLRLVVPGWVGDDWVKWLTSIRIDRDEDAGFFMHTAYRMPRRPATPGQAIAPEDTDPLSVMPVKSLISRPTHQQQLTARPTVISGVAWAGETAVARVEISVDGGKNFQPAALDPQRSLGAWQRWRSSWQPGPGRYRLVARATDAKGRVQPERPAWNPGGYLWNGLDSIDCEVRA